MTDSPNPENVAEAASDAPTVTSSRVKFLTIVSIAFGPMLIAYLAFMYFPDWAPSGTTNEGELIMPPVAAAEVSPALGDLEGWGLVMPLAADCADDCREILYLSRQVVTGLGKNTNRVSRYILAEDAVPAELQDHLNAEHKDLRVIQGNLGPLNAVNAAFPLLFLVDPNGNVMMYFTLEKAGKPMLGDLKHLLKLSNIG